MKNKILSFWFAIIIAFGVIGCSTPSNSSSEDTYSIEIGVVSNSIYSTAMSMATSYGVNITHSNMKTIRDYLYLNTISNYDNSVKGVKKDEIRDFLVSKGLTEVQANAEVAVLETLGNDIVFFYYAYSTESKVWMYAEKE